MKLESRVEKLENESTATARRHVILKSEEQSDLSAIEVYGRDRVLEGEDVEFIELVALTSADAKGRAYDRG